MQNTSTQQNQNYGSGGMGPTNTSLVNDILNRVKLVLLSPKIAWAQISSETTTVKSLYMNYAIPLAGFMAVCQFLSSWLVGTEVMGMKFQMSMMGALNFALTQFVSHLIAIYVAAWILSFLAPKFSGQGGVERALQLVVYASTPNYIAAVFGFIPGLWIATLVLALYSIYIFWIGVTPMVGVADTKRIPYTIVSVIAIFITMLIIGMILTAITGATNIGVPDYSSSTTTPTGQIKLPGGVTIDPEETQRSMEQLQRMFPQGE